MSEKDIWLRFGSGTHARKLSISEMSVGSFSNDDGDGNENVKKAWLLATSPATNNKYPATWNLSGNPDQASDFCS